MGGVVSHGNPRAIGPGGYCRYAHGFSMPCIANERMLKSAVDISIL